jgi:uncharacterized protein (DUF3084 family)
MQITLTGQQRLILTNKILPEDGMGSFEEALAIKRLRDEVGVSQEELQAVNTEQQLLLSELEDAEIELDDTQQKVIALGFLHDEQDNEISSADAYLDLYKQFQDTIQNHRT